MKVVVFGASGKVGQKVVHRLLSDGHSVTAFVFRQSHFDNHKKLKIVKGDVKNFNDVSRALAGNDAVISILGSWGTKSKDILAVGMSNIIPIMEENGMSRIISLTGHEARDEGDKVGLINFFARLGLTVLAGKILHDGEEHIRLLRQSNLGWTVVRSPLMNERGSTKYAFSKGLTLPWLTINRQAVATAMVDLLESGDYLEQSPVIRRV